MSKYDYIFNSEDASEEELEPEESVAAIAYLASVVDFVAEGSVGLEVERDFFRGVLSGLFDREISVEEHNAMIDKLQAIVKEEGVGALYNAAYYSLSEEWVPAAMSAAYGICLSDGNIPDEAAQFLSELQESLEISNEDAIEIRDRVIEIFSGEE